MLQFAKDRIQIHRCEQLLNISNHKIDIQCKEYVITVIGNDLKIHEFGLQQIIIIGKITTIGFVYE